MSGRGTTTGTEVCFISELYTLLRLLKAPAKGVLVLADVDARSKDERGIPFTILFKGAAFCSLGGRYFVSGRGPFWLDEIACSKLIRAFAQSSSLI